VINHLKTIKSLLLISAHSLHASAAEFGTSKKEPHVSKKISPLSHFTLFFFFFSLIRKRRVNQQFAS
jgi:hypothetical protein